MVALLRAVALCATAAALVAGCAKPPAAVAPKPDRAAVEPGAAKPESASAPHSEGLTVFAGSASKPALEELGELYEAHRGTPVAISFGGSGSVYTQFKNEQYGDVYVPGSDDFMDKAQAEGSIDPASRTILVYLVPAICVAKGNPKGIQDPGDFTKPGLRVVIGETESVCLGAIAKAVFTEAGNWEAVRKCVASYAESCEKVSQNLLLGEADAVIGWDVFAAQNPDKIDAIPLTAKSARPRNIPAAAIRWSKQPAEAKAFIAYLASDEAKAVWRKHGYTVDAPAPN